MSRHSAPGQTSFCVTRITRKLETLADSSDRCAASNLYGGGIPSSFDRVSSRAKSIHKTLELARTDPVFGSRSQSKDPAGCEDLPRDASKASLTWVATCVDTSSGVEVKKALKGRVS